MLRSKHRSGAPLQDQLVLARLSRNWFNLDAVGCF